MGGGLCASGWEVVNSLDATGDSATPVARAALLSAWRVWVRRRAYQRALRKAFLSWWSETRRVDERAPDAVFLIAFLLLLLALLFPLLCILIWPMATEMASPSLAVAGDIGVHESLVSCSCPAKHLVVAHLMAVHVYLSLADNVSSSSTC